jgi:Flp pilus assembly protein TadG
MFALRPFRQRSTARRRGATVVEAALVLPIVMMFLIGILEYGRYVMMVQVLTNAAREGAHYALAHTEEVHISGSTYGNTTADVINAVNKASAGQKLSGQSVTVYKSDASGNTNLGAWTDAASGEPICVRITGTFNFIVPKLLSLPTTKNVTVKSVMRSEGNELAARSSFPS